MPLPAQGDTRNAAEIPVVVIGASAGGLDACRLLLDNWHGTPDFAFIVVQHLEPTHESMLVALLATHTKMSVTQAEDGAALCAGRISVIAPGKYLLVESGIIRFADPDPGQGVRLPLDTLLFSLARQADARTACIILSGTGTDGTAGAAAIKLHGGYVIAQDPAEAEFNGMPRSVIDSGAAHLTLSVKDIPAAVTAHFANGYFPDPARALPADQLADQGIGPILDWLHFKTNTDFRLYKTGTLTRRIERRMQLLRNMQDKRSYLEKLKSDDAETAALAQDLLINVTEFFRDPQVFDYLENHTFPELLAKQKEGKPLRIWVAGCSTGEEAYSLGILILDACEALGRQSNVQIFASDADGAAIDLARAGRYSSDIGKKVSQQRLDRYFLKTPGGFQVHSALRNLIVFTVHDVLTDLPFARLDLISCRNLLIYLGAEAQKHLLGLFHFSLAQDGLLLLGTAETAGSNNSVFIPLNKPVRLFQKNAQFKPAAGIFMTKDAKPMAGMAAAEKAIAPMVPDYGELCRRLVLDHFAPAAVLINAKNEWLYAMGPTRTYLRGATGYPTQDLLALVSAKLRSGLENAIREARSSGKPVSRNAGQHAGAEQVRITAIPLRHGDEALVLVSFAEVIGADKVRSVSPDARGPDQLLNLEHQLADTRSELAAAILNLEKSNAEQAAINAEAMSVNEEYQSANEELLTSKEELQSLNEELTALNSQLQETLDLHRTTSNDLQNVLYSTNVATIFLDRDLNIRFFTPATKAQFNVIPGDIGRPLSDLSSLASDANLLNDARFVLETGQPKDREIRARTGEWFLRRVLPYLAQDGATEGVVITFVDVTQRRQVADDLGAAKRVAETATIAKSRFLAAASHDLRQPLQTLSLLQGLLATMVNGEKAIRLVERFGTTLASMSGMLSTLLDINQIEAGTVQPEPIRFGINELFERLQEDFSTHAAAQGLALKIVPCSMELHTDPRLLEQVLRNLLSNALKYTKQGKILLGCRRRSGKVSIEIWDTGIGIPDAELQTIFQEYHQLDNPARERGRGLGLGLAIVQSLVNLLGFNVHVRSALGKGSMFAIEISLPESAVAVAEPARELPQAKTPAVKFVGGRCILIVEDDPDVRELLELFLAGEGYQTLAAKDGDAALALVSSEGMVPDLILADYNLPNAMNGIQFAAALRERLSIRIPVIILTGDISTKTARQIELEECVQLNKPVKLKQLMQAITRLALESPAKTARAPDFTTKSGQNAVYVVDDDEMIRTTLRDMLEMNGFVVGVYATSEDFLEANNAGMEGCLLVDAYLPGMSGLQLLETMKARNRMLPSIMITGRSDVPMAVAAMKAGAADFFEKPISAPELLASIERVFERSRDASKANAWHQSAIDHINGLTSRQREVMHLVLAGHPSKNIAADLGISQRTVENHRAAVMKKTGSKSLPALARLALAAEETALR